MFDFTSRRLLLALILLISHLAVTAHSSEQHKVTDNIQCELCVGQGSADSLLHVQETWFRAPAFYTDFSVVETPATITDCTHPAWTSRAPPL